MVFHCNEITCVLCELVVIGSKLFLRNDSDTNTAGASTIAARG